jgi:hypothetical protein
VMTAFSYVVSNMKKDNYKEPLLLADFLEKTVTEEKKQSALPSAWTVHYLVGLLFGLIYEPVFAKIDTSSTLKSGLYFGVLAGTVAIIAWSAVFKIHPDKPKINYRVFYRQLVISHLIFGVIFANVSARQTGLLKLKL